ncbi:MAG: replicative DNA helicase [bacterium]|nr:replicative DNA helicase [bacterium]
MNNQSHNKKIPPHSLEAEISTLGAMMMEREAISRVLEILNEDLFYWDAHKRIWAAILNLYEKNEPVDLITLTEQLKKEGNLDEVGGAAYLAQILNSVPTAANVEHYARIVAEKGVLRKLISSATEIVELGYQGEGEVSAILDKAESLIFDVVQRKVSRDFVPISSIIHDSFEEIERLYAHKEYVRGVPSGFIDLDIKTSGFQSSDLIIIAGRPSMGKSSLCLNIVQHAGIRNRMPVAIFSLEMSKEQLVQRMLCSEARVSVHKLRTGFLSESDWPRLTTAAGILSEAPIFIDDTPAIQIVELKAKARRIKARENVGLIVIDYLQLMQGRGGAENRQQEISEISRSLKALAKELDIPIIALSQLSRAVEVRGGSKRPQLSDLRESGAIEQDADLVTFIYREEYYNPTEENEGIAEIIIGKQRNGPTGTVKLRFFKEYTRFENLSTMEE